MTVGKLRERWPTIARRLRVELLAASYRPGAIRRAMIPKASGGQRGLGIPNFTDRVVMEAVRQVLEPLFEPTFDPSSHGFRAGRSCHPAIAQAKQHVRDGYEWVVDIDLEKFFDRVNHQRLTARLARRVDDRRLLGLIGRMLKARIVLPDGVVIGVDEGVPQGSPLSPLLSNVVLDELDIELVRRGHRFVRYADDRVPRALKEDRCRRRYRWMRCCTRDEGARPYGLVALRGRPAGGGRKPPRGAPEQGRRRR
jgi:RNA-directed DNA polymerase